jgi:hypothetical protein
MSDEQSAAGSFTVQDRNSLKQWLDFQPDEYSTVISSRAALRALPFLIRTRERAKSFNQFSCWVFSSFWASALAWAEAKYPSCGVKEFSRDAYLAAGADDEEDFEPLVDTADAAALAALAVSGVYSSAEMAARAVDSAEQAYGGAPLEAIWQGVAADVAAPQEGSTPEHLASAPLWSSEPDQIRQHWLKLRSELSHSEWRPWLDWYQRRLDGRELSQDIETLFASLPVDPRDIDVDDQNEHLAEKLAALSTPVMSSESAGSNLPKIPDPAPGPRMAVRDERLDIAMHRAPDHGALGRRSTALLAELREAVRDFANSFDTKSNQHRQLRNVLNRYRILSRLMILMLTPSLLSACVSKTQQAQELDLSRMASNLHWKTVSTNPSPPFCASMPSSSRPIRTEWSCLLRQKGTLSSRGKTRNSKRPPIPLLRASATLRSSSKNDWRSCLEKD